MVRAAVLGSDIRPSHVSGVFAPHSARPGADAGRPALPVAAGPFRDLRRAWHRAEVYTMRRLRALPTRAEPAVLEEPVSRGRGGAGSATAGGSSGALAFARGAPAGAFRPAGTYELGHGAPAGDRAGPRARP